MDAVTDLLNLRQYTSPIHFQFMVLLLTRLQSNSNILLQFFYPTYNFQRSKTVTILSKNNSSILSYAVYLQTSFSVGKLELQRWPRLEYSHKSKPQNQPANQSILFSGKMCENARRFPPKLQLWNRPESSHSCEDTSGAGKSQELPEEPRKHQSRRRHHRHGKTLTTLQTQPLRSLPDLRRNAWN